MVANDDFFFKKSKSNSENTKPQDGMSAAAINNDKVKLVGKTANQQEPSDKVQENGSTELATQDK